MTSLVRQLEAKVVAAMETVVDGAAKVTGFRASVAQGLVKSQESDGRPEVIVAVNPATSDSYASPVIGFDVAVSVRLEWADDPTITAFDEIAALVERKFIEWNLRENYAAMTEALTCDNFRCDGFRLGGGSDGVDADPRPAIFTTMNFTVKGVFIDDLAETTNENQEA